MATTVILVLLYIKSVNLHERKQPVGLICWLYEKFSVKSKVLACNYFFFCRPIYHHRCNNQTFIVGLNLEIYLTVYGYNTGHYFNKITNKPPVEVKILDYMFNELNEQVKLPWNCVSSREVKLPWKHFTFVLRNYSSLFIFSCFYIFLVSYCLVFVL